MGWITQWRQSLNGLSFYLCLVPVSRSLGRLLHSISALVGSPNVQSSICTVQYMHCVKYVHTNLTQKSSMDLMLTRPAKDHFLIYSKNHVRRLIVFFSDMDHTFIGRKNIFFRYKSLRLYTKGEGETR